MICVVDFFDPAPMHLQARTSPYRTLQHQQQVAVHTASTRAQVLMIRVWFAERVRQLEAENAELADHIFLSGPDRTDRMP